MIWILTFIGICIITCVCLYVYVYPSSVIELLCFAIKYILLQNKQWYWTFQLSEAGADEGHWKAAGVFAVFVLCSVVIYCVWPTLRCLSACSVTSSSFLFHSTSFIRHVHNKPITACSCSSFLFISSFTYSTIWTHTRTHEHIHTHTVDRSQNAITLLTVLTVFSWLSVPLWWGTAGTGGPAVLSAAPCGFPSSAANAGSQTAPWARPHWSTLRNAPRSACWQETAPEVKHGWKTRTCKQCRTVNPVL